MWAVVSASGYTSETFVQVFSTEKKAVKEFQTIFDEFIKDSENEVQGESFLDYAIDDIKDKLGGNYTVTSSGSIDWNLVEKLYRAKVASERHFRYDGEVITEVSVQKIEVQ